MVTSFLEEKEKERLENLKIQNVLKFYEHDLHMKEFIEIVVEKIGNIKLYVINWFVTNYVKKNNIYYSILRPNGKKEVFYVFESYLNQLNANKKKEFDPFFRCQSKSYKLSYTNKTTQETLYFECSIGQLNFFRWAIENLIIDYIRNHVIEIRSDMKLNSLRNSEENSQNDSEIKKHKKTELSKSCHTTPIVLLGKTKVSWLVN